MTGVQTCALPIYLLSVKTFIVCSKEIHREPHMALTTSRGAVCVVLVGPAVQHNVQGCVCTLVCVRVSVYSHPSVRACFPGSSEGRGQPPAPRGPGPPAPRCLAAGAPTSPFSKPQNQHVFFLKAVFSSVPSFPPGLGPHASPALCGGRRPEAEAV